MRLASFAGGRAGLVEDERILDLGEPEGGQRVPTDLAAVVALGLDEARRWVDARRTGAAGRPLADVTLDAPIVRPGKIVAAPINYLDHQVEMRQNYDVSGLGVFLKASSSVVGSGGQIRLPYVDRRFDHEGELAVVIGATGRHVPVEQARSLVFGYTCLLDITMRGGEDRSTRKSFDTFTPMGPWIVTADEIPDPGALELTCAVNGQVRQHASTADLIWGVDELLTYVTSVMTLYPGDVVSTGTPAGVGPLEAGDVVEVTVSRIGTLTATVTADGAGHCPTRGAEHGPVAPAAPPR
jgi:2-keto-4-pentenoate hydratase/2-oxohepta-3-ene-1,7-dioic acid hydratase in catechol pathway